MALIHPWTFGWFPLPQLPWLVLLFAFTFEDQLTLLSLLWDTQERDCWVAWNSVLRFVNNCQTPPPVLAS